MKKAETIEAGDLVDVCFMGSKSLCLENVMILYVPNSAGECWVVRDAEGGIIYIQCFEIMSLRAKGL